MSGSGERSQGDVLGERFRRVPWRRLIGEAIRERLGSGPTALPERLEGAVFGQLVGGSIDVDGTPGASGRPMLARLESLLAELSGPGSSGSRGSSGGPPGPFDAPGDGLPADALPVALVWRDAEASRVAGLAATAAGAGPTGVQRPLASALYALLVRGILAGERRPGGALGRATRDLRGALAARGLPGVPQLSQAAPALAALDAFLDRSRGAVRDAEVEGFWSGWDAFDRSSGYEDAVTRARDGAAGRVTAAAVAGGLAGARWGSSAIPGTWRRALPDGPRARELVDRLIETDTPGWDGKPWRTSTSSPLRVDGLDLTGLDGCATGAVGITFLPGRRYVGYHTGAQWRDLETDAARLRDLRVDVLLLLVEDSELVRCRVTAIGEELAAHGVELVRFPIRDPLLPRDGAAYRATVGSILRRVRGGASVAIACRGGLDRAGMTSACLLREAGLPPDEAIARVQRARRGALTLPDQQAYVRAWPPA